MNQVIPLEPAAPILVGTIARPFSSEPRFLAVRAGATVADILHQAVPDPVLRRYAVVQLEGEIISPGAYRLLRPKAGKSVAIRVVPGGRGGGGKNIWRTIAMIAVIVVSAYFTYGATLYLTPSLGGAGAAAVGAGIGAAVPIGGAMIIAATLPERAP